MPALEILALIAVTLAAVPAIAHVFEFPGKRRLNREDYFVVQRIYYPGFTLLGGAEPLAVVIAGLLVLLTPVGGRTFWLIFCAFVALVAMHAIFWIFTQPVNRYWLEGQQVGAAARRFLGAGSVGGAPASDWTALRDQWEYSHLARAALSALALFLLFLALVRR